MYLKALTVQATLKEMKTCSKCSIEKDLSCFYDNSKNKDGKTGMCIECVRAYQKQRYDSLTPDQKKAFIQKVIENRNADNNI